MGKALAFVVAIILIGWVGIPAFFVVVGLWNIIKTMAQ